MLFLQSLSSTGTLVPRKERRLRAFEIGMLRRIFGSVDVGGAAERMPYRGNSYFTGKY
jgi:hypothetical protein